jgi:hypothetical protein
MEIEEVTPLFPDPENKTELDWMNQMKEGLAIFGLYYLYIPWKVFLTIPHMKGIHGQRVIVGMTDTEHCVVCQIHLTETESLPQISLILEHCPLNKEDSTDLGDDPAILMLYPIL